MNKYNYNTEENYLFYKKYKIFYRIICRSKSKSNYAILFLHAKDTHSEYIESIAKYDFFKDYTFFALDYPGKGRSSGIRGHCDEFDELPGLISLFITKIIKQRGFKKLYIIGESIGSFAAFHYSQTYQDDIKIKGLIFLPGVFRIIMFEKKIILLIVDIFNKICPKFKLYANTPIEKLTESPYYQEILRNDPYFDRISTMKRIKGIYKYFRFMMNNINKLNVPVMIFHGEHDHYSTAKDAELFFNTLPEIDGNKLIILNNCYHFLLGSEKLDQIARELYNWLQYNK